MAANRHVVLGEGQRLARGNPELGLHQIDPGHHLGHRVLDLYARVHLDEVELVVVVQELERADAAVSDVLAGPYTARADAAPLVGPDARSGGLLDHLLVPTLDRAVAFAERDHVAVGVGDDLDLHMPGRSRYFSR